MVKKNNWRDIQVEMNRKIKYLNKGSKITIVGYNTFDVDVLNKLIALNLSVNNEYTIVTKWPCVILKNSLTEVVIDSFLGDNLLVKET